MWRLVYIFLVPTLGCSLASKSSALKFKASHDLEATVEDQGKTERLKVAQGETLEVTSGIATFEAPHRVPLTIVIDNGKLGSVSEGEPWTVNLKKVDEWRPKETEAFITNEIDQLYQMLIDVLVNVKSRKVSESINKANEVLKKYPKISSLHFVKAQLELMDSKVEEARHSLELCLSISPQYIEAKKLLDKINQRGTR